MKRAGFFLRHRFRIGLALIGCAVLMPVTALLLPVFGGASAASSLPVGLLLAGGPETLCLAGIAVLGKEGFSSFRRRAPAAISRLRYYGCLTYCLLNGLPITLYAYAPDWMPGGPAKMVILALADIGFIASLFLMGGEFWEKFRRLFIWEGKG